MTHFHARILLVDNVHAALATNYTAVLVTSLGRLKRIPDAHNSNTLKHFLVWKERAPYILAPQLSSFTYLCTSEIKPASRTGNQQHNETVREQVLIA
ncbi:hypothetical protein AY555_09055 [Haematospirillum jordaniae]|uniref:Uncharacterized protein n=1 Tax=Haematospirillum jordaniae TaxID=1549855 RepID=A0A143DFD8_9PROT|nr:hypothetical protein AY555_09055 [Haematospirillum jordaniae]